jgi:3-oxoacyl-[acyl-carrier protein] reductase
VTHPDPIMPTSPSSRNNSGPLAGLRVAVIGSTTGIGRATALTLARDGADVIVHGRTRSRAAEDVAASIRSLGRNAEILPADLADRATGDRLVDEAWSLWGGLDAWLHFAGVDTQTGPAAKDSFDVKLDRLWAVDVVATIRLCREVGRRMTEQGHGSIVTMGWDQAETGMEGDSGELFAATKGAILAFTRSLSKSLAPKVRVNAVSPGWIKTAWGDNAPPLWQDRVIRETPLGRWGTPENVADAAAFLVSPRADFLTGQVIRVNGGAVR